MQSYYHASSTNGTFVATETEPSFQEDEWILKSHLRCEGKSIAKNQSGTRLDMTCWPIKSGTSLSMSWQDTYIGNNALSRPVCGRERPDSHKFKVSNTSRCYLPQNIYISHLQVTITQPNSLKS